MNKKFFVVAAIALWLLGASQASAQWLTETIHLKPGWNAVYLHVDASHDTLNNIVGGDPGNPILEVWMWKPTTSVAQFTTSPDKPIEGVTRWVSWNRTNSSSALQRVVGNAGCLVRVGVNVSAYDWHVKGMAVAPNYSWTSSGLNLVGFPTVPASPPSFFDFLGPVPQLRQNAAIYQYVGGELGDSNPMQVYALRTTPVQRGEAFWIRAGDSYNRYFAPFELSMTGSTGIDFGDNTTTASFRIRNLTPASLTVSAKLVPSESVPANQPAIANIPPLVVRGPMNKTNMVYGFSVLGGTSVSTWTLAASGQPGSEVEVVLGLDRASIGGNAGDYLAGILQLTDSMGFALVNVPVSATKESSAGLWVGTATVSKVGHYLKEYVGDGQGGLAMNAEGQYVVGALKTNLGSVAQSMPLRLIVHNPETGNARLLQRVYWGLDANTNNVLALNEAALNPKFVSKARRISAVHLPWEQANVGWLFGAPLGLSSSNQVTVTESYNNKASNPFLHEYHPDHDNLDTSFKNVLPQGSESYKIVRTITLYPQASRDDFAGVTSVGQTISGRYYEKVVIEGLARPGGNDHRDFSVQGTFTLNRITEIPTLVTTP